MEVVTQITWHAYLVECADGTLYAGSTNDIARRICEHNDSTKGAKYTRVRRPVVLRYACACASRSEALQEEARIKKLTRVQKLSLIAASDRAAKAYYI